MVDLITREDLKDFEERLEALTNTVRELSSQVLPKKHWLTKEEACKVKGINLNTANNKPWLLPKNGKRIGGRVKYHIEDVLIWADKSDEQIEKEHKSKMLGIAK